MITVIYSTGFTETKYTDYWPKASYLLKIKFFDSQGDSGGPLMCKRHDIWYQVCATWKTLFLDVTKN